MSTDIIRKKDGTFVAVNDRFQIPEGIGSTLETDFQWQEHILNCFTI